MGRILATFLIIGLAFIATAVGQSNIRITGSILTTQNELVAGALIKTTTSDGKIEVLSDGDGNFSLEIPNEPVILTVSGKNIVGRSFPFTTEELRNKLNLVITFSIPPIHEELVISAESLEPTVNRRDEKVFENTLFSRDDQIFQTLDSGINAGQHEGGGKSLEIRRFGFNLDHGGVNGGLKVLTDNVQQNQGTQGHGQGYLGSLKSLSPELVKDVEIINGPFSAEYGDFSGLGVVHIKQREELPQQFTARLQGGRFNTLRSFLAFSPQINNIGSFIAYEHSQTDGPFLSKLDYGRDNLTTNLTLKYSENRTLGFKFNGGLNRYKSSGQIPLDEVFAGRLDTFGLLDPDNGGKVGNGTLSVYFRNEFKNGSIFKIDGFMSRSLFDLWSNFTFFLNDVTNGDEVQQHDSRLQEGASFQYLKPFKFGETIGVFTAGGNVHLNQINVGLYRSIGRNPYQTTTKANAKVNNSAGYVQQSFDLFDSHLHLSGGLRFDVFNYRVVDLIDSNFSGNETDGKMQPKFNLAYTPNHKIPFTVHFNYGRGITSQDARSVVQKPENPKISTTDFYQFGTSFNSQSFSATISYFLIDRSNEQVYIPDDGSIELSDPSRSYGLEVKSSFNLNRFFSLNAGLTQVFGSFYRRTSPRIFVDSAPHQTLNGSLIMSDWKGFTSSLRNRHIGNYRLDGEDDRIRATGFDVIDLSVNKRINKRFDFNLSIDNLANKRYFETQNFFESRLTPTDSIVSRIHATPGFPVTITGGITVRFGEKK